MGSAIATYSSNALQPVQNPELARTDAVGIKASQTIAAGTVMGEVGGVNATSTITITASTSGGFITLSTTVPTAVGPTAHIAWSATNATLLANIQTALDATFGTTAGSHNVVPSAVALTAGIGTILLTCQNGYGQKPVTFTLADSTTGGTGVTIASTTTGTSPTGNFAAYSSTATDGTQTAKGVLKYDVMTDASGNVTFSTTTSGGDQNGATSPTAPIYTAGFFACEDLTGLDAAAISTLGRIVKGNTTAGVLFIG